MVDGDLVVGGFTDQCLLNSYIRCHPESLEDVILVVEVMGKVFGKPSLQSRHAAMYFLNETITLALNYCGCTRYQAWGVPDFMESSLQAR